MTVEEEIANRLIREIRDGGDEDFDISTDTQHDIRILLDLMDTKLDNIEDLEDALSALGYPGKWYYVQQDTGTDSAATTGEKDDPFDTPDYAWSRVDSMAGDVIVVLPSTTQYDGDVNVGGILCDQAGTAMISIGGSLAGMVNSNAGATAVMTVSVSNILIGNFYIPETTNTVEGIVVTGTAQSGIRILNNIFEGTMENGIRFGGAGLTKSFIEGNGIWDVTNDGIELASTSGTTYIRRNFIFGAGDNGIHLNGDDADNNVLIDNIIQGAGVTTTGINITLGDYNTVVGGSIGGCTNCISDTGTDNIWDVPVDLVSSGSFNRAVADGVGAVTEIDDLDLPSSGRYTVKLDVDALDVAGEGGTITARLLGKTDDTNYTIEDLSTFDVPGADEVMPMVSSVFEGGSNRLRVTFQTSIATTANRIVYWKVIKG